MKDLPIRFHVLGRGADPSAVLDPAMHTKPRLLIIDYLQLLPNPHVGRRMAEADAAWVRELKAEAVHRPVACLLLAQLPDLEVSRPDPRPTLNDYGALGSVKQHADTVLHIFREEMYRNDNGLDGATELIVAKNRNGTTGFIDLYFYKQWMRFEDMLDPDR
jgi:replicative DNA helicase